jgi:hypothetical protein
MYLFAQASINWSPKWIVKKEMALDQGDQIWRFFAIWVIVHFWEVFKTKKVTHIFVLLFS